MLIANRNLITSPTEISIPIEPDAVADYLEFMAGFRRTAGIELDH
jgi:hypothetical protein